MATNQVGIIIGMRNVGKSLFVLGSEFSSKVEDKILQIRGLIRIFLNKKMKILFIDTLDHPSYRHFTVLKQSEFKTWTGIRRIYFEPDDIVNLVDLINKTPSMNNTFIVFEDAGKYTDLKLPKPFKRLIADSKQRNIDILFMYHCFMDTPTDVFRKGIDYIQLFKTEDHPAVRKNNLRLYDKVEAAYNQLKASNNRFDGKYIDTRTN